MTTLCHSVFSLRSPLLRSFQVSDVAMLNFTTLPPLANERASGSRPRLPTRTTLLTEPALALSLDIVAHPRGGARVQSRRFRRPPAAAARGTRAEAGGGAPSAAGRAGAPGTGCATGGGRAARR